MLLLAGTASLLLTGCGTSGRDEGMAALPPVEHITVPEEAWIASLGTLFNQGGGALENAWRIPLGPATDLERSATPYVVERIVPKA